MPVTFPVKFNAFIDLGGDGFSWLAVRWIESIVVAECTTAMTFAPIPVRTGESGIQSKLLNPFAKYLPEKLGIAVETSPVTPWVCSFTGCHTFTTSFRFTYQMYPVTFS
jgi:hypothetical protein